jgi:hypothetical protein
MSILYPDIGVWSVYHPVNANKFIRKQVRFEISYILHITLKKVYKKNIYFYFSSNMSTVTL